MMQEINWLNEIFLTTGIWGLFGPFLLVVVGYVLAKESKVLATLWFIVDLIIVAQYFDLVSATPSYWWNILIILLGGIFLCVFPALAKRR